MGKNGGPVIQVAQTRRSGATFDSSQLGESLKPAVPVERFQPFFDSVL